MDNKKKLAIVILLLLLYAGFSYRHIDIPNDDVAECYIEYQTTNHHVRNLPSGTLIDIQMVVTFAATTAFCIIARPIHRSHIEYCGKKMVRAIMLQWRPD